MTEILAGSSGLVSLHSYAADLLTNVEGQSVLFCTNLLEPTCLAYQKYDAHSDEVTPATFCRM